MTCLAPACLSLAAIKHPRQCSEKVIGKSGSKHLESAKSPEAPEVSFGLRCCITLGEPSSKL